MPRSPARNASRRRPAPLPPLPPRAPGADASPRPWLFNPALDLIVGAGAWSLPLILFASLLDTRLAIGSAALFYALTIFFNNPHYMATLYRAYGTQGDFSRYKIFTVYITAAVLVTGVAAHFAMWLVPVLVTVYLTWSPFHYTGQNFGIGMMLARRGGVLPATWERHLFSASFHMGFVVFFLAMHSGPSPDMNIISLGLPREYTDSARVLLAGLSLAMGMTVVLRWAMTNGWRAVAAPAVLVSTQFLWFGLPTMLQMGFGVAVPPAYYSAGVLAFLHSSQYLWVTSYYARRETEARLGAATTDARTAARMGTEPTKAARGFRFASYFGVLIIGGIALFVPGPWIASRVFGHDFITSFLIFSALVNLHHFILDGAIWKLRDGRIARLLVGRAASPEGGAPGAGPGRDLDAVMPPTWVRAIASPAPMARVFRYAAVIGLVGIALVDQLQALRTDSRLATPASLASAARMNPSDPRPLIREARLLADQNNITSAIATLQTALRINPRSEAQYMMGTMLVASGDLDAARKHYAMQPSLVPPDATTHLNAGVLAGRDGDTAGARNHFEAATQLAPENPDAWSNLAEAQMAAGNADHAAQSFARAMEAATEKLSSAPFAEVNAADANRAIAIGLRAAQAQAALGQTQAARATLEVVIRIASATNQPTAITTAEEQLKHIAAQ